MADDSPELIAAEDLDRELRPGGESHRRTELGEAQRDHAATCIYLDQIKEVCAVYARAGTKEAADRKLNVKSLLRTSGRASEPTHIQDSLAHHSSLSLSHSCERLGRSDPDPHGNPRIRETPTNPPSGTRCPLIPPPPHQSACVRAW